MKNRQKLTEILYTLKPEKYSTKPTKYIIWKKDYGLYTKKEADIICNFINDHLSIMLFDIDNLD